MMTKTLPSQDAKDARRLRRRLALRSVADEYTRDKDPVLEIACEVVGVPYRSVVDMTNAAPFAPAMLTRPELAARTHWAHREWYVGNREPHTLESRAA